jgi:hypothetical protein
MTSKLEEKLMKEVMELRKKGSDPLDAILTVLKNNNWEPEQVAELIKKDKILLNSLMEYMTNHNLSTSTQKLPI